MKILVAEDDAASRDILSRILSRHGEVNTVADGEEALAAVGEALKAEPYYDLICLDVMMPGLDGKEALFRIRELEAENGREFGEGAKIMMVTALTDPGTIMDSYSGRCDSFVSKPIDHKYLERQLTILGLI